MTRDEIMAMDDDALRIAVARALGYEARVTKFPVGDVPKWFMLFLGGEPVNRNHRLTEREAMLFDTPDYPRDIAAAYELEDALPEKLRPLYSANLMEVMATASGEIYVNNWLRIHAGAADRCRAWLLTNERKTLARA